MMEFIVCYEDCTLVRLSAHDVILGEYENYGWSDWEKIKREDKVKVEAIEKNGNLKTCFILQVVDEGVDTTDAMKMYEVYVAVKKMKLNRLLLAIPRVRRDPDVRDKRVPLSLLTTDSENDTTHCFSTGHGNRRPSPMLHSPSFQGPSSTLQLNSSNHSSLSVNSFQMKSPSSQFQGDSVYMHAKNYVERNGCQWGSVEGLYHLHLLTLREVTAMKTLFTNGRQEFTLPIPVKSLAEYETLKTIIHDDNQLKSDIIARLKMCMCTKIQEFVRRSIDLLIDRPIQCLFNRTGGIDRRNPGKAPKISFQECLYDLLKEAALSKFRDEELSKTITNYFGDSKKRKLKTTDETTSKKIFILSDSESE